MYEGPRIPQSPKNPEGFEVHLEKRTPQENDPEILDIKANGLNLDYQSKNGLYTFFTEFSCISKFDKQNKFTEDLYDCVALVVVGRETRTGETASLISHFNPKTIEAAELGSGNNTAFTQWLSQYLESACATADRDSLAVYLVGGKEEERFLEYGDGSPVALLSGKDDYEKMVSRIKEVVIRVFEKEVQIPVGPSKNFTQGDSREDTRVYINTQERKVFVVRKE